jgi:hypothetical protein
MRAFTKELSELDNSTMGEATFLTKEGLVVPVEVLCCDCGLMCTIHCFEGCLTSESFGQFKIESNKRR